MIPRRRPGVSAAADPRQVDSGRHHAFITYARRPADLKFVDELCDELEQRGKRVWVDRADIPPGADWLARIAKGIETASSLIFVVSPSSVASEVCNQELAIALEQNKRVIPVLHQEVDPDALPPALAKLNWIPFTVAGERPQSFEKLVEAIDTDLDWRDDHTRLTVRANEWVSEDRDRSFLLRGRDLRDALRWYADAGAHKESPTPTQLEYVMASRHEAARRQRLGFAAVSVALGVAIVLAIFALVQRSDAIHQTALAQSQLVAIEATDSAVGDVRLQDLLGLAAYSLAPTTQARGALVSATEQPLVRVLPPAVGEVNAVAYSPDGRAIAVGGVHGVALWNAASRTRIGTTLDAAQQVNAVAFTPDGSSIVVAESDGFVKQIRLSDHSVLRRFATDGTAVTGVAVSPSGQDIAAVTGGGSGTGEVFFWVPASNIARHVTPAADAHLLAVAFSPDNALLAVGGAVFPANGGTNGLAVVYHLTSSTQPTQTFSVPGVSLNHVAFSPDGATLAAADGAGNVDLFSPANPSARQLITVGKPVQVLAFAGSSSGLLATGDSSGAIRLWNYRTQQPVGTPLRDGLVVYALAFSPDGRSLAGGGRDGSVFIWSANGRTPIARTIAGGVGIQQLSLNPAATQAATADRDGSANLWNLATGRRIHHFVDHDPHVAITSAEFGPTAGTVALGLTSGEVEFVNAASATPDGSVRQSGKSSPVNDTAFSPDNSMLAVGHASGEVELWNLRPRRLIRTLMQPTGPEAQPDGITALAFNPQGTELVVGSEFHRPKMVPTTPSAASRPIIMDESPFSLVFSPDGSRLYAGDSNGNVEIFDATSLARVGTFPGDGHPIFGETITPDSRTLATVDESGALGLWDLATSQELGVPLVTPATIFTSQFSANGSELVTGDSSGQLVVWPSIIWSEDPAAFRAALCPRLGVNLTKTQWSQYLPAGRPYQAVCPQNPAG